jgi:hypothetical protein
MWRLCKAVNHILWHRPRRLLLPLVVDGWAPTLDEQTACHQAFAAETFKEACTSHMYVCGAKLLILGPPLIRRRSSHNQRWYMRTRSIHASILSVYALDVALPRSFVFFRGVTSRWSRQGIVRSVYNSPSGLPSMFDRRVQDTREASDPQLCTTFFSYYYSCATKGPKEIRYLSLMAPQAQQPLVVQARIQHTRDGQQPHQEIRTTTVILWRARDSHGIASHNETQDVNGIP